MNDKNNMTKGSIRGHLLRFAFPLLIGDIFQQLYNTVDSIIVGQFVGEEAFAAVGIAHPVVNVVLYLIVGICVGASVLMSQMYGSGDEDGFRREVSTAFILGGIGAIVIGALAAIFVNPLLSAIETPAELMAETRTYLLVIFAGLIFTFLYNIYSAAFRAIGNAKASLSFLIFSSIANVFLDLLFVVVFKMGVVGAAVATVIAQAMSVVLCVIYSRKKIPILSLKISEMRIDKSLVVRTFQCSWGAAIQQASLHIGVLLLQRAINTQGTSAIAAYAAVSRLDAFVLLGNFSISNAMTTFIAQNMGAGEYDRIRKGFHMGRVMLLIYCACACLFVTIFKEGLISLFLEENSARVVELGVAYYYVMAPAYLLAALGDSCQGYFRGMSRFDETLIVTIMQIIIRVSLTYLLVGRFVVQAVAIATATGWATLVILSSIWQFMHMKNLEKYGVKKPRRAKA